MANYGHVCECGHFPSSHEFGGPCDCGCVKYQADQAVK